MTLVCLFVKPSFQNHLVYAAPPTSLMEDFDVCIQCVMKLYMRLLIFEWAIFDRIMAMADFDLLSTALSFET